MYIPGQSPEFYRAQRKQLKAQGICTRCRTREAAYPHTKCLKCLEDTRIWHQKQKVEA